MWRNVVGALPERRFLSQARHVIPRASTTGDARLACATTAATGCVNVAVDEWNVVKHAIFARYVYFILKFTSMLQKTLPFVSQGKEHRHVAKANLK